jgi:site-specific DNA recombinase
MELEDRFQILSSIFPEKLKFDGKNCRTPKINQAVSLLLSIDGGSRGNKKGDKLKKLSLSLQVELTRTGSNRFMEDLLKLKSRF